MMRAIGLDYEARRLGELAVPDPVLRSPDSVLVRVDQVGICATDRGLAQFRFGYPPRGESFLVLGHEMLGRVEQVGSAVRNLEPGDLVTATVRRPCEPACPTCARGRNDLCLTGGYRERGIFAEHGYFAEYAVDAARYFVRVPAELGGLGVLIEPLSVVEKAVERAFAIREETPANALVLGAGPVGLLTALALGARGVRVSVHSIEPAGHYRARLAEAAGARYIERLSGSGERFDLVIEASGSAEAGFAGIALLGALGVCIVIGGSAGRGDLSFFDMVLNNQAVAGIVNASPAAFAAAAADLVRFDHGVLSGMLRQLEWSEFESAILGPPHEVPKLVHVIH
jgi:glucose 1-dehydrogenase